MYVIVPLAMQQGLDEILSQDAAYLYRLGSTAIISSRQIILVFILCS